MKRIKSRKRRIFIVFNQAMANSRRKNTDPATIEKIQNRLRKALGIMQSDDYYVGERRFYHPTADSCGCFDRYYYFSRNRKYTGRCAHSIAVILEERVKTLNYHQTTFLVTPVELQENQFPGKIWVDGIVRNHSID